MQRRTKTNIEDIVEQVIERASKPAGKEPKKKHRSTKQVMIPTGATLLDLVCGGGYPAGKIINIVGDKSTGKTYLSLECIASARRILGKKLKWFYDDAESGFSFDTQSMYGFEVLPDDQARSSTVEDFRKNVRSELGKLKDDEFLIYVLDSLDSLTSDDELKFYSKKDKPKKEGEKETGTYGMGKQKEMSAFFRLMARDIKDKNCLLIIISQVRHNIGVMFGEQYTRAGGKALDFYAHICLWLAAADREKKMDRVVGVSIKAKTKKAKIKTPFRECFVDLVFDYGIDDVLSNIAFLYDLRSPQGKLNKADKLEWDGVKDYHLRKLVKHIEDNDLEAELRRRVVSKWNEIEEKISSKGRKPKWL